MSDPVSFAVRRVVPILRIFSEEKAREFYVDYLGMTVDWEHRFEPDTPVYMQVSRAGLVLHLSEHHGDGVPGTTVFLDVTELAGLHRELHAKGYRYLRPGIERMPWNAQQMVLIDPFGNKLRLNEYDRTSNG